MAALESPPNRRILNIFIKDRALKTVKIAVLTPVMIVYPALMILVFVIAQIVE